MLISPERIAPERVEGEMRGALLQRLLPSALYELTQITASVAIECASARLWAAKGAPGSDDAPDMAEARQAEDRAVMQMERANALLRNVVEFGDPRAPGAVAIDVAILADMSVSLIRNAMHQQGAVARTHVSADLPSARSDPIVAQHLLMELLLRCAGAAPGCSIVLSGGTHGGRVGLTVVTNLDELQAKSVQVCELQTLARLASGLLSVTLLPQARFQLEFTAAGLDGPSTCPIR